MLSFLLSVALLLSISIQEGKCQITLWNQEDLPIGSGYFSYILPQVTSVATGVKPATVESCDDIIVPAGVSWNIDQLHYQGFYLPDPTATNSPNPGYAPQAWTILVYNNSNLNLPSTQVLYNSTTHVPIGRLGLVDPMPTFQFNSSRNELVLSGGTGGSRYWICLMPTINGNGTLNQYLITLRNTTNGYFHGSHGMAFRDDGGVTLGGNLIDTWLSQNNLLVLVGTDELTFSVFGYSIPLGTTQSQNQNQIGSGGLPQTTLIGIILGVLGGIIVIVVVVIVVVVLAISRKPAVAEQPVVLNSNISNQDLLKKPGYESLLPIAGPLIASEPEPSLSKERFPSEFSKEGYEIDYSELEFEEEIGRGAYGVVFFGRWRGGNVAIKQLNLIGGLTAKELQDFRSEAALMKRLRPHVNVVQFLGITSSPTLCIVTEYLDQGSLFRMVFSPAKIDANMLMNIAKGIAAGMLHLHREGVVHRDLAARNILLGSGNQVKISDFGLSRVATSDPNKSDVTKSDNGPLKWMSPEAIKNREYSRSSDVWAFGVTLYEIVARTEPYTGLDAVQAALEVTHNRFTLEIPSYTPSVIAEIMGRCFEYDPTRRPDFAYICRRFTDATVDEWLIQT